MLYPRIKIIRLCAVFLIVVLLGISSQARSLNNYHGFSNNSPKFTASCNSNVEYAVHDIGKIGLTVVNMGHFGRGYLDVLGIYLPGDVPSMVYPFPGENNNLFVGSIWIGAVVGEDTLVSVGADGWLATIEMWPAPDPEGLITSRTIYNPYQTDAVSEQDFVSVYTDTVTDPSCVQADPFDNRPHLPLNLRITQKTYAWSHPLAEDFVIFDYAIENIGTEVLNDAYVGIYVDGDVGDWDDWDDAQYDICGFKRTVPDFRDCDSEDWLDTIDIAWIADMRGIRARNYLPCPEALTLPEVTGIRLLAAPSDSLTLSYNWWISNSNPSWDWGPRLAGTTEDPFRTFASGALGTPMGDRDKYYMMSHNEIDYDVLFSGLDHTSEGWLPPAYFGNLFWGFDTRYLLSFGSFDIQPGEVLPITFAYVGGENFHTDCDAFMDLFDPDDPSIFADYLDFTDLGINAVHAAWMYDHPGVDTDGDSFKGHYRLCARDSIWVCDTIPPDSESCRWEYNVVDTIYTSGDGVPDFGAGIIPPGPSCRLEPITVGMKIRWNGFISETTRDIFGGPNNTEGYHVHFSPDSLYGYTEIASYEIGSSDPTDTLAIHKRFPGQPYPTTLNIDSASTYYPDEVVTEGSTVYFKYFEYEYTLRSLLPYHDYCVGVTVFNPYAESRLSGHTECGTTLDVTGIEDDNDSNLPRDFAIKQNYPNPFNPSTSIEYALPVRSHVAISIYNLLGQKIGMIVDDVKSPGVHSAVWDGKDAYGNDVASGVYFYQIQAGDFVQSRKMLLLK
jgi:hypothetical protein